MRAAAPTQASCALVGHRLLILLRRGLPLLAIAVALLSGWLLLNHPERLAPFLATTLPLIAALVLWARREPGTLPILPVYLLVQAIVYALPLLQAELVVDSAMRDRGATITPALFQAAALDLALWFPALWLGWQLTPARFGQRRPAPPLSQALERTGSFPTLTIAAALAIGLLISSPFYWSSLGDLANGLLSPLRTLQGMLVIVGAFTGAYAWSRGRLRSAGLWLLAMLWLLLSGLASLLLSAIQLQVLATLAGLWLGRSRQLLPLSIALLLTLSFLHQGKQVMRTRYWGTSSPPPLQLMQEWVQASLETNTKPQTSLVGGRLNSFSNLIYVEDVLQRGAPTLNGESFAVIPQVLLPRVLNEQKVRSQEGQVLLNLHFGRQRTRADTEKAYIAWGLLTEAIGNYGVALGPLLVGPVVGALIRLSENLGRHQALLSTPGLMSLALALSWITAYESAASTFTAAVFQSLVVIAALGWWLTPRRRRRLRQPA